VFRKGCALALLLIFILASSTFAQDSYSGVWETSQLCNKIIAHVKHEGDFLSGVVTIYEILGEDLTYHFAGTLKEDKVEVSHHEGHVFRGKILSNGKITGLLTTKTGVRIKIELKRQELLAPIPKTSRIAG